MNEFDMIHKYFLPLTLGREEAAELSDDAAILDVPDGYDLVVSSDTLNAGTHFLKNETPENIAHKALRVNLSDIVAMGARPYSYQMNIAFQNAPDMDWVKRFSKALLADSKEFDVFCSGGDTTVAEGPMLVSMTITGLVPHGRAVRRNGTRVGDLAVVTGAIGDAVLGVKVLLDTLELEDAQPFLQAAQKPTPRVNMVEGICDYARAAIDISDGLVADVCHLCEASGVGLTMKLKDIPISDHARAVVDAGLASYETLLTGGEDYEIVMAVSPADIEALQAVAAKQGVPLSVIGTFDDGEDVIVLDDDGQEMSFKRAGWTHF